MDTRDSNGKLGVKSQGAGGDVNISTQVNVDNSGSAATKTASNSSDTLMKQFGDRMTQTAKDTVVQEMRPGGLLWKWRNGQA